MGMADPSMPNEPGKCYAKSLTSDSYIQRIDTLGVYGLDEDIPSDLLKKVETVPQAEKWEKKKADINCLSADPEDCLVWCLVKQEAEYATPVVRSDSTNKKKYVILDARFQNQVGSQTVWKEVLCPNDSRSNSLITNVNLALLDKGYDVREVGNKMTKSTKEMLIKFQQDNGLDHGQLDIDTLSALGIL